MRRAATDTIRAMIVHGRDRYYRDGDASGMLISCLTRRGTLVAREEIRAGGKGTEG